MAAQVTPLPTDTSSGPQFDAFISYSHAADNRLCPALQKALQQFSKKWYTLRVLRVFRDKTSLAMTSELWPTIQKALERSRYFLLMASPEAARSEWVQKEISWWINNRSPSTLFIIWTDGSIIWNRKGNDFEWPATTSLPELMQARFRDEPKILDLRWARAEEKLTIRQNQFREIILDLSATIQGRSKEDLDGEDIRQHRRFRIAASVAAVLIVAFAALAGWQAIQASNQRNAAVARQLAAQSQLLLTQNPAEIELSVLLSVEAARRLTSIETDQAIRASLPLLPKKIRSIQQTIPEGKYFHWDDNGSFLIEDTSEREYGLSPEVRSLVERFKLGDPEIIRAALSPDKKYLAVQDSEEGGLVWLMNAKSGKRLASNLHTTDVTDIRFNGAGNRLITVDSIPDSIVTEIKILESTDSPRAVATIQLRGLADVQITKDGRFMSTRDIPGPVRLWDVETGREFARINAEGGVLSDGGRMFATFDPGGKMDIWDLQTRHPAFEPYPAAKASNDFRIATHSASGIGLARIEEIYTPCGTYSCDGTRVVFPVDPQKSVPNAEPTYAVRQARPNPTIHVFSLPSRADSLSIDVPSGMEPGFSATGNLIAGVSGNRLMLWDANSGKAMGDFKASSTIYEVQFSTNDEAIAVISTKNLEIFDRMGKRMASKTDVEEGSMARDGSRAWAWNGKEIDLFDPHTGKTIRRLIADSAPEFASKGGKFAARTPGGITIWDAATGEVIRTLATPDSPKHWIFTPEGTHLITVVDVVQSNSAARIWDIGTGQEVARIANTQDPASAGIWRMFADKEPGRVNMILGSTFTVDEMPVRVVWRTSDLIDLACNQLTRNMTPDEWNTYLGSDTYRQTCGNLPAVRPAR